MAFRYYKQFEAMSDEEVSRGLREKAQAAKRKALERVEPIDLSRTTWPQFPHPDVVAAVTFAMRRGVNSYADPQARALRAELGRRHGLEPERIAVGNGAAELLETLAAELLELGDELVTPWPSYPLYPLLARRAGAQAVPVPGRDHDALLAAITGRTRLLVLCNPNDPTGAYTPAAELDELIRGLPERVVVCLDQALIDFVEAESPSASLALLDEHPRLIVLRTFSKIHGLAGMRCGYALGGPGSEPLMERLAPALGVGALAQAGALEALRKTQRQIDGRRELVAAQRGRLLDALAELPVDVEPSQANLVWLTAPGLEGAELAARLQRLGVMVRAGQAFGATDHVRAAIHSPEGVDRLLRALGTALD
ncbi:MAG TPA: aminotransferase class I/II-fold pyridoxal phosphate-dependent enzyme [Solirubrobacteraceae bacterium]|nr:aminotransferase class I/II-fold pyridoxal phosphate-dependent enzyme [Solirubrobacteraceae bacterium]